MCMYGTMYVNATTQKPCECLMFLGNKLSYLLTLTYIAESHNVFVNTYCVSFSPQAVQEALDKASEGRTCVVIAHRLCTVRNAAHIFVLDGGIIAESGTHADLVVKKGAYYRLYQSQLAADLATESA